MGFCEACDFEDLRLDDVCECCGIYGFVTIGTFMNVSKPGICDVSEIMISVNSRNCICSEWGDVCEIMHLLSLMVFEILMFYVFLEFREFVFFVKSLCLHLCEVTKLRIKCISRIRNIAIF